jgi:hypothetical protein
MDSLGEGFDSEVLKWKVDENSAAFSTVSFKRVH